MPRQQVVEAVGWMIRDAGEDVGKPGLRIHAVHLGRDDEAIHYRCALSATIRAAEQPGFAPEGDASQRAFGGVVADADPPIVQEPGKRRPPLEQVVDGARDVVAPREPQALFAQPPVQFGHQRCREGLPGGPAHLGVVAADVALDVEQGVNTLHRLQADRREYRRSLALGRPARTACDIGQDKELSPRMDHPNAIHGWRFRVKLLFSAPRAMARRPRLSALG